MANFITVKRVYVKKAEVKAAKAKGGKAAKLYSGSMTLNVASIAAVRASNRLGYPQHRSTITLMSGQDIDVADEYKAVTKSLKA